MLWLKYTDTIQKLMVYNNKIGYIIEYNKKYDHLIYNSVTSRNINQHLLYISDVHTIISMLSIIKMYILMVRLG